ncbi:MAG: AarF/ABC1/UbiB kinase family protein [Coleofasciculaceae cyanobacterium SM2_1_6]|nr:AarF/ABC1/UbiB kinase family protein [Coleofasciculaceae cyanobacterium SM2_1_6]
MLSKITQPESFRWQKSNASALGRQRDIFLAATQWISYLWWDSIFPQNSAAHRYKRAKWVVRKLLDLGPTFIKIGQALSTRGDILPLEYVEELAMLQDNVPAFGSGQAIAVIEADLGKSIYAIYRDFDPVPIAAASLGQVHRARLHTGEEVVVKVQRPGLQQLFDLDVQALQKLVHFCYRYFSWAKKYELQAIYEEFVNVLYQEIDYTIEGKNADRFRENFQDYPGVIVPKLFWQYSSKRVLTIEYKPGIKINDCAALEAQGINLKELNLVGVSCYLKQLLIDGFFQADPHPGNMAVSDDGQIIFYDFGMMVEMQSLDREQMIKTFFAILKKDTNAVIDALVLMGLIEPVPDMTPVRRLMDFILQEFTEKPLELPSLKQMGGEIYEIFEEQPFRLPAKMTFIIKALTTLDGIARTLDPKYNPIACAKPFVKSFTNYQSKSSLFKTIALQAKDLVVSRWNQPSRTELLWQRLEERLERGELQLRVKSLESDRTLKRINIALKAIIYACISGFTLLTGAVLLMGSYASWAVIPFTISTISFFLFFWHMFNLGVKERLDKLAK